MIQLSKKVIQDAQEVLKLNKTGVLDNPTKETIVKFQMDNNLLASGELNKTTLEALGILDTSIKESIHYRTENGLAITRHYLPEGEYLENESPILNDYLFIHHSESWNNPFKVIDYWGKDKRGRVGTEFVIGGQNIKTGDTTYDGQVAQAFPEGAQAFHLGATGSYYMNRHSVGIELCTFGHLTQHERTYTGLKASLEQICYLEQSFKNFIVWHKYSDEQLKSLKKLIIHVSNRDNIDLDEGLIKWIKKEGPFKAFDFHLEAYEGKVKGLLTHGNVRKSKSDCFPQPELVDMLLTLI